MKESKKVSISGVGFVFDIDAYELLAGYLDNLNQTYKDSADGEEIVADIAALCKKVVSDASLTLADVAAIGIALCRNCATIHLLLCTRNQA